LLCSLDGLDVLDVYVDRDYRVWLIDINPFGTVTDGLMFSWEELVQDSEEEFEFRVIDCQIAVQPKSTLVYRLPKDIIDLSSRAGIERFADAFRNQTQMSDSDVDEVDYNEA
jgi:hypothetical protein